MSERLGKVCQEWELTVKRLNMEHDRNINKKINVALLTFMESAASVWERTT